MPIIIYDKTGISTNTTKEVVDAVNAFLDSYTEE